MYNLFLEESDEEKKDKDSKSEEKDKKKEDTDKKDSKKEEDDDDDYSRDADTDILASLDSDDDPSTSHTDDAEVNSLASKADPTSDDTSETSGVYEAMGDLAYLCVVLANNLQHIHFHAVGKQFDKIHELAGEYYRHFRYRCDAFAEIALQGNVKLDNFNNASQHVSDVDVETNDHYNYEDGMRAIDKSLKIAIEHLENIRSMAESSRKDIQSTLDDELSYLYQQSNYAMNRRLNDPISESYSLIGSVNIV